MFLLMFLKSDPRFFITIGIISFGIFSFALFYILKKTNLAFQNARATGMPEDIQAIAGEDMIATQLDLARAYIEISQTVLAKDILRAVMKQGSARQKAEAKALMVSCE